MSNDPWYPALRFFILYYDCLYFHRSKVVVHGAIGAILVNRLVIFFSCLLLMGFIIWGW